MGKFYLDVEFTNGNYYLVDILEIALVAGESENVFHSYVKMHDSVPKRVQELTGITNKTINTLGVPFRNMMDGLVEFLRREQAQSEIVPVIIAHWGYLHDFQILLPSCMFVDSMQVLQDDGYKRSGLDALFEELNKKKFTFSERRCLYIKDCL